MQPHAYKDADTTICLRMVEPSHNDYDIPGCHSQLTFILLLRAAARGERSKEIALHLGIAERTVKAHLDSVYNKLGVDSRAAAVATAIERGLLTKQD